MNKLLFLIFLIIAPSIVATDGTGVDPILREVGLEKPENWQSWSKAQKHSFLYNLGITPKFGRHFKGQANTDGFFEYLQTQKPKNWDSMSFEQKNAFVQRNAPDELNQILAQEGSFDFWLIVAIFSALLMLVSFFKPGRIKKAARVFALYIFPLLLITFGIISPSRFLFLETGRWAEYILIFLLLVKPISVVFQSRFFARVVRFRKELGLTSFWLFLVHAVGFIALQNITVDSIQSTPYLLWGTVAGIMMVILGLTSNKWSVNFFKENWKKIQYLAYPALLGTLLHTSMVAENMPKFYIVFSMFMILKILQWKKIKISIKD